jgi:hypothetical protein
MTGESYQGRFLLQNLGNVPARFEVSAKSTRGNAPLLAREVFALAPGATDTILATVVIPASVVTTVEEVLLVSAVDVTADSIAADASLQATVIPKANAGPSLWTVPAEFAFRTAAPGTGVSAFTASGEGKLMQGSDVTVDFMLRGPTGKGVSFGDQETYRLAMRSNAGLLRLGDQSFGFSPLLASGGRSTGAEVRSQWNGFVGGAYLHRDRTRAASPTEASFMVGTNQAKPVSGSVAALSRSGKSSSAQVVSASARATFGANDLDVEVAASDSMSVGGQAGSLRLTGTSAVGSYDMSAQHGTTGFASMQQGVTTLRGSVIGRQMGSVVLTAATGMNSVAPRFGVGQRQSITTLGANWTNGVTAELEHLDRADVGVAAVVGTMQSIRLRGRHSIGRFEGSANFQGSLANTDSVGQLGAFSVGTAVTAHIGENQYLSLFADYRNGRGLGDAGAASMNTGVNSELRMEKTTVRFMSGVAMQASAASPLSTNSDLSVEHSVRQVTLGLRGRFMTIGSLSKHALFLEVKRPFGLPTSPMNDIGRARIEIMDAESGKGVAGALVRIAGQAAVTDANGIAMFRDLKPGEHRAIIDGAAVAGRLVASGGAISISATSRKVAQASLSLSRGARVVARIRSFERASALATGNDTLTEIGAVGQMVVALVTPSGDTLWQTSDERGRVDFGGIAPGRYTVAMPRYEVKDRLTLAQSSFEIEAVAGASHQIEFKLIPQVRTIEFVGEAVIIAAPVKTQGAPTTAGPTTITGKPQASPITNKPDEAPITAKPQSPAAPITAAPSRTQQRLNQNQNPTLPLSGGIEQPR